MKTLPDARELARAMISIGCLAGRNTRAVLTDMETPLGSMMGNALEVQEAIATLQGHGADDLRALCLALAEETLLAEGFTPQEALELPSKRSSLGQHWASLGHLLLPKAAMRVLLTSLRI